MQRRICSKTGLALTAGPVSALRIARESYGPFDPLPRDTTSDVEDWSRYDTIGRTIYATADKLTAFMELLAPYRTDINGQRRALQPLADFMGVPLEDLWRDIVSEWDAAGTMKASWLPRIFREGRSIYTVQFPKGWWIDITASETISALADLSRGAWPTAHGMSNEPLTLSHLTGDDRFLTTSIATVLREDVSLDDGTLPLGIEFISKHGKPHDGTGTCWAYWMRDVDNGLDETATATASSPIEEGDKDFLAAQVFCKIKSR